MAVLSEAALREKSGFDLLDWVRTHESKISEVPFGFLTLTPKSVLENRLKDKLKDKLEDKLRISSWIRMICQRFTASLTR